MSSIKPNNFPPISGGLSGNEEIYTQTGGNNNKFTVQDVSDYVLGDGNLNYVETTLTSGDITALDSSPALILDVSSLSLNSNEIIYVEDVLLKYNYGTVDYSSTSASLVFGYTNGTKLNIYRTIADTFLNQSFSSIAQTIPQQDYLTLPQTDLVLSSTRAITGGDGTLIVSFWYRILTL